jgi:hypothetical protein
MIEFIFTIDYELYGSGHGNLRELVYEPTERLMEVFRRAGARFVPFVEVAELEVIESNGTDAAIDDIRRQVHRLYAEGFTPGLHLHPQWYEGRHCNGEWVLNYAEYNLCVLSPARIAEIVDKGIRYLRTLVGMAKYTPIAFRAGNRLFQPTSAAADVLVSRGVRIDSSVFKGGCRREYNLDYRRATANGYYWRFRHDAARAEPTGPLLELPIFTRQVPFWEMSSGKRLALERRSLSTSRWKKKFFRLGDLMRFRHPLKLDFCRMTRHELISALGEVIRDDERTPTEMKPIVAIGHTKELVDLDTVEHLLSYLAARNIRVSTFDDVYEKCE